VHANTIAGREAAEALGLSIEPITFPEGTKTARDAADAIGCEVAQIVKSLIFDVDGELVVALVSGANQLDEAKLAGAAGGAKAGRVDADRVRAGTGFPIGGVPPFGHASPLRGFVDGDLLTHREVWAAAGTGETVFAIDPEALVRACRGSVCELRRG
jgi:prolyl-tRNA editing enzyme YbaK/EbsC (Cys-tRNA(Pro) deacylase)